jgi:hypothetical protein
MAFNFSKIELSHHPAQRKAALQAELTRRPQQSLRA